MVEAWRGSGQSLEGFARRHGVDWRRLRRWSTRLDASAPAIQFHPVRIAEVVGRADGAEAIEIELRSGHRVRVPRGFEAEDLRRVVAVLEGSGC
jgi:hypothetical protein